METIKNTKERTIHRGNFHNTTYKGVKQIWQK